MTTTFAYLGPEGTFTEEAAILYDSSITRIPEPSIVRVGAAVVEDPYRKQSRRTSDLFARSTNK